MIPILFDSTETAFTSQGLGRLLDARRCEVTEERNGIYELVLEYPADGPLFGQIAPGNYILATHDDNGDMQAFEIYRTSAPLDGWVTVNAWHISYKLNTIVVQPFTANTCAAAIAGVKTNSLNTNPFTFQTDKVVTADFALDHPEAARAILGGMQGSLLDVYGAAEYEFDMFTVKLHAHRGANNGVVIRYGKNLRALDLELDASNRYNTVVPYWTNGDVTVYSTNLITRTGQTAGPAIPLDLSAEFEDAPTVAQLEAMAQSYIDGSTNYTIKDNLTINMVPIWQTEDFKNFAAVERVGLCDTVTIIYTKWNIEATAKVIKVVYNTLLDRYASIELGEPKTTLSQQIAADLSGGIKAEAQGAAIRAIDNLPDASTTERGLVNTGAQTFGGDKTVDGTLTGKEFLGIQYDGVSDEAPKVKIIDFDGAHAGDMIMAVSNVSAIGKRRARTFRWRQFGINTTTGAKQSFFESYTLPTGPINLTENHAYNIWTTKAIPEPPTAAGTYTLRATRTSSGVTYSWV